MGLFDEIVGGLEKGSQQAALYEEVAQLVREAGGVNGLYQKFQQNGLEGVVAGWIGGDAAAEAQQIVQVVGQDRITAIASRAGLSEQQAVDGIARLLPLVVGHLSSAAPAAASAPDAPAPEPADLEGALGALKSKLLGG